MPVVCIQLRPLGDKRGSYRLVSSVEGSGTHRDRGLAWSAVYRIAIRYPSILVIEYDHHDEMSSLYAVKKGECRNLHLIVWRKAKSYEPGGGV